jgi:excinuclease Cho
MRDDHAAMMPELSQVVVTVAGKPVSRAPRCSGVYRFYAEDDALIYIGKSVDIHARLLSHFNEATHGGRHHRMMSQVVRIDCELTSGEVGALLRENAAIKAESPLYNRRQRRLRRLWTIVLEAHRTDFLQPLATSFLTDGDRRQDCYGLFGNQKAVQSHLRRLARDHGLCLQVLGMERGSGPCFQFQLRRCDGACAGEETAQQHNARLTELLSEERINAWPFAQPIILLERNTLSLTEQPEMQYHAVDHWAYYGTAFTVSDAATLFESAGRADFDRDTYRLLMNALRRGKLSVFDSGSQREIDNPLLGETVTTL